MADPGGSVDPVLRFLESWPAQKGLVHGWIEPRMVAELRGARERLERESRRWTNLRRLQLLGIPEVGVHGRAETVLDIDGLAWRVAAFRALGWLELLDQDALVDQLARHQVLEGRELPEGRRGDLDRAAWQGLFAVMGWDPIRDTYLALAALEQLDGVGRIDRESCIRGLLRYHEGRGLFLPPAWDQQFTRKRSSTDSRQPVHIQGDATTTFAVRESLRILGALDRVKDLAEWEYRVHRVTVGPEGREWPGVTWARIEAVLMREGARGGVDPSMALEPSRVGP